MVACRVYLISSPHDIGFGCCDCVCFNHANTMKQREENRDIGPNNNYKITKKEEVVLLTAERVAHKAFTPC